MSDDICEYISELDGARCTLEAGHQERGVRAHKCVKGAGSVGDKLREIGERALAGVEQTADGALRMLEQPDPPGFDAWPEEAEDSQPEPARPFEPETETTREFREGLTAAILEDMAAGSSSAPGVLIPPPADPVPQEFSLFGHDLFGEVVKQDKKGGPLSQRFEFPPFTVLNAREGDWQERKRQWVGLGIKSEVGRGMGAGSKLTMSETIQREVPGADVALKNSRAAAAATAVSQKLAPGGGGGGAWLGGPKTASTDNYKRSNAPGGSARPACDYSNRERGDGTGKPLERGGVNGGWSAHPRFYEQKVAKEKELGRELSTEEFERDHFVPPAESEVASGTSIFDPVLTELCYRWFCPKGGQIVDPFAGGSVRGVVAGALGFKYHGIELRAEQIAANQDQRDMIVPGTPVAWACGDSLKLLPSAPPADFLFSCPPYGDLERYSDEPEDLSTMEYPEFLSAYRAIIAQGAAAMKPNRLACFVVGDFRDKKTGYYRGFVADTINAFRDVGLGLYNDAVLVTAVGSLPIRVSGQFESGRKLGKTHQNVLCFAKGDPRKAFEKEGK